jgi:hypothetical protein
MINVKKNKYTLLHWTLYKGYDELSVWLINHGADISLNDNNLTRNKESIIDLILKIPHKLVETSKLINNIYSNSS